MAEHKTIFCTGCQTEVSARLIDGKEAYSHRPDLSDLPFWKCDTCKNFVGCHHKTKQRTKPLGVIPTNELKKARSHIHRILDPLWKSKRFGRSEIYSLIAEHLQIPEYRTGELKTIEDARKVWHFVNALRKGGK
jgi:hypothetical protein